MENNQLQVDAPGSMKGGDKVVDTTEDILEILDSADDDTAGDKSDRSKITDESESDGKEKRGTKKSDEESDKEDGEEEEKEEIEEDETTKEEAVDELITPVALKEVTAKYPNLLKDFPFLEKAYYREKKFTEIFPTVADARDALERLESVGQLEQEVLSGKTDTILKAIKDSDPKNFEKLVEDYLPALGRVSPEAFYHIMANHVRQTVLTLYQSGQSTKNVNLQNAALVLSDFFWPGQQLVAPKPWGNGNNNAQPDNKLNEERQKFENERLEYAASDVNTRVQNALKATIDNNLDKQNVMPEFVKRNAIKEVQENLEKTLLADTRFSSHMTTLWNKAKQNNYSRSHMDNIRSAYLGKAKTVLGPIIAKVRNEALKGVRRARTEEESNQDRRGPVSTGRPAGESKSSGKGKSIPQGMSVEDYLMSD